MAQSPLFRQVRQWVQDEIARRQRDVGVIGNSINAGSVVGNSDANARVGVRKNSAGSTFLRRRLNLIEGSNITLTVADDSGDEEIDITVDAGAASAFTGLSDTPASYSGAAGQLVAVNATPDGLEFVDETQYLLVDGSRELTSNWDIGDTRRILADGVRARDAAGLRLEDDGGDLGVHVSDGGQVGIGGLGTNAGIDVYAGGNAVAIRSRAGTTGVAYIQFTPSDASAEWGTVSARSSYLQFTHSSHFRFITGGTERARLTSSFFNLDVGLGESWNAVSFNTGWGNVGGIYETVAYRRFGDMVMLKGFAERSSGTNTTIFTLPAAYRPSNAVIFAAPRTASPTNPNIVRILSTGEVEDFDSLGAAGLDGIWFYAP